MRFLCLLPALLLLVTGSGVRLAAAASADPEPTESTEAVLTPATATDSDPEVWACCHPYTYECFLLTEQECMLIGGIWLPGMTCDPNPWPSEYVCCLDGDCYIVTEEQCDDMGGDWRAAAFGCDSDPCNPQSVEEEPAQEEPGEEPDPNTTWGRIKALYRE